MASIANPATLAINGGPKSVPSFQADSTKNAPRVGLEEFLAIAETFGYSSEAQAKIRAILAAEDHEVQPNLVRYYNPRPSKVSEFETKAREVLSTRYALGVNSGTSALIAAYVAAGVGPGTEVIIPAYTFYASAAAVVVAKGIPVIAEINQSMTLDPADVERKITPRTKAIVPVHMLGMAADMGPIMEIARRHGIAVIEDTAQACGGRYHGQHLGTIGDLGCYSLSSYKTTGAGEAGLVVTDNEWLYIRAMSQHDTAACWRPDRYAVERRPGELFCGENYRMSELAGAVNLVQMGRVDEQFQRYNANMRRIVVGLDTFRSTALRPSNDLQGDLGYCIILTAESKQAATDIGKALAAEGLPAGARGVQGSRDWHIYSFWEQILEQKSATLEGCPWTCQHNVDHLPTYSSDMCPRSADLFDRAVFLRVNQWWTEADCDAVAAAVNKVCGVLG